MRRTYLALMFSAMTLGVVSLLPAAAVAQSGDQARVLVSGCVAADRPVALKQEAGDQEDARAASQDLVRATQIGEPESPCRRRLLAGSGRPDGRLGRKLRR